MKTIIATTLIILGLVITLPANADIGVRPVPSGLITVGDKTDEIQMKSETVTFDIRENDGTFKEYTEYYAHVTAQFTMVNLTSNEITKQLVFPFHYAYLDYSEDTQQAVLTHVQINGDPVDVDYAEYALDTSGSYDKILSGVFDAAFAANAETDITIEYDLRAVNEPKSQIISFEYLMQTGSNWAGMIENGTVEFSFWEEIDDNAEFSSINDFFEIKDGKLVWEFINLEPDKQNDIQVSFDPELLGAWANRPEYIESVTVSRPEQESEIWISLGIRDNEDLPGGQQSFGPYNVILEDGDEWRGWLTQWNEDSPDNWLNLTFNIPTTLKGLSIKTGIITGYPKYYDTFRRPKTIEMTFSDSTTQTVILDDNPDEFQEITLENKKTSSLKIAVQDTYEGVGGGNAYLGIGRIQLNADTEALNQELDESRVDDDLNNVNTNIILDTNANTNLINTTVSNQQFDDENEEEDDDAEEYLLYLIIAAAFVSSILLFIVIK